MAYTDPDCVPTEYGPCQPYATADDLICGCGVDLDDDDVRAVFEHMLLVATERVFNATGGRYTGCCQATIRPCRKVCGSVNEAARVQSQLLTPPPYPAVPVVVSDAPPLFVNVWACSCQRDECSCTKRDVVRLPWLPVRSVDEVVIDGAVFTDWWLQPGSNLLWRTDGLPWPSCQDQSLPDSEPGTWGITFSHGLDIPATARPLVAAFACELTLRCLGEDCKLPDGVQVISRPGVEFALVDWEYRRQNLTGYVPLDDWILSTLGGHAVERPRMFTGRGRRGRSVQG